MLHAFRNLAGSGSFFLFRVWQLSLLLPINLIDKLALKNFQKLSQDEG
jgi:hypothetical protein